MLGQSLYYLLTTGSGQQTLGEEYCDISQVIVPFLLERYFIFCPKGWSSSAPSFLLCSYIWFGIIFYGCCFSLALYILSRIMLLQIISNTTTLMLSMLHKMIKFICSVIEIWCPKMNYYNAMLLCWCYLGCTVQVATLHGLPPTPAKRILFILYQTTVPYLAERIRFETNHLSVLRSLFSCTKIWLPFLFSMSEMI